MLAIDQRKVLLLIYFFLRSLVGILNCTYIGHVSSVKILPVLRRSIICTPCATYRLNTLPTIRVLNSNLFSLLNLNHLSFHPDSLQFLIIFLVLLVYFLLIILIEIPPLLIFTFLLSQLDHLSLLFCSYLLDQLLLLLDLLV